MNTIIYINAAKSKDDITYSFNSVKFKAKVKQTT